MIKSMYYKQLLKLLILTFSWIFNIATFIALYDIPVITGHDIFAIIVYFIAIRWNYSFTVEWLNTYKKSHQKLTIL